VRGDLVERLPKQALPVDEAGRLEAQRAELWDHWKGKLPSVRPAGKAAPEPSRSVKYRSPRGDRLARWPSHLSSACVG
jgi:hypothetical protein